MKTNSYTCYDDLPKWSAITRRYLFFTLFGPFILIIGLLGLAFLGVLHAVCWAFPKEVESIVGCPPGK